MIIKGGAAGNAGWWGAHLTNDEKNERVEVKEIRGLTSDTVPDALFEMKAVAAGSRSQGNSMYQANINVPADEHLTEAQWKQAFDTLEKNLGLDGHQRIVVEHDKEGRVHRHAIWNRVDVDTMRVVDIGGNYRTHERTARQLEVAFDLTPTPTPTLGQRRAGPELWEMRAEERSGILRAEVEAIATEAWRATSTSTDFVAAIEDHDLKVARGDRRDFVLVDQAGDVHSLARRVDGVKTAELRERMHDVDRDALPSVQEARQEQRERFPRLAREVPAARLSDPVETISNVVPFDRSGIRPADDRTASRAALNVVDGMTGAVEKLTEFVADFLTATPAPPASPDQLERLIAQERAAVALENIAADIKHGQPIGVDDVRNLTPSHLRDIRDHGDDYLRQLVETMHGEREREREADRGRAMER